MFFDGLELFFSVSVLLGHLCLAGAGSCVIDCGVFEGSVVVLFGCLDSILF